MTKQCFKCHKTKPISEFYAHPQMGDGHLGKCKTCAKRDVAERVGRLGNNPEWLAKERERCRIKQDRYRRLGLAYPTTQEARERWERKNPHKRKAECIAASAQKRGLLKMPKRCVRCKKKSADLEKHHNDYSKPLEVEWLCTRCHGITRRKQNGIHKQSLNGSSGLLQKERHLV